MRTGSVRWFHAAGGLLPARKGLFHSFFLFLLCSLSARGREANLCGIPGRSERGIVSALHSSSSYSPGQRAEYSCQRGFTQLGNSTRVCQHDGLWSGTWPRCVDNLAYKKPVASSAIIDGYRASFIVDADVKSCIYLDMRVVDRYVQIDLGRNHLIAGIVVHVPEGYVQQLSIFVAEKLATSPGIQYRRCANSLTRIENSKMHVECRSETGKIGVPGRFLHIRDEREVHDFYFALCEVQVYSQQAMECQPLTGIDNGSVQLFAVNGLSNHSFNSVARHQCNDGFTLVGDKTRTCNRRGSWTGSQPTCRRIECGPLRPVANAFHRLMDNHTRPGAFAQYFCIDGYVSEGIAGDRALVMSTVCQRNGSWKDVYFHCSSKSTSEIPSSLPDGDQSRVVLEEIYSSEGPYWTRKDPIDGKPPTVTTVAVTSLSATFILILLVIAAIALNVCRMGTVFRGLRERVSLLRASSGNNQLFAKDPGVYQATANSQVEVKLEPEPLYNELSEIKQQFKEEKNYLTLEEHDHMANSLSNLIVKDLSESQSEMILNPVNTTTSLTLEEILQLYAKVDKSKKKNRLALVTVPEIFDHSLEDCNENDENSSDITINSVESGSKEKRPLPPIPSAKDDVETEDSENHIYATLPIA